MGAEGADVREIALEITRGWEQRENFELYEDVAADARRAARATACGSASSRTRAATSTRSSATSRSTSDAWISSGTHGKVKPSPTIFRAVLELARRRAGRGGDGRRLARRRRRGRPRARDPRVPDRPRRPVPGPGRRAADAARPAGRARARRARRSRRSSRSAPALPPSELARRVADSSGRSASARSGSPGRSRPSPPTCRRSSSGSPRSGTLIGLVLALEGVFALTVPLLVGPMSDATTTSFGRRRPYLLLAVFPMAAALAVVAFMPGLLATAAVLCAFFFAYNIYEPPYRGLYPDLPARGAVRALAGCPAPLSRGRARRRAGRRRFPLRRLAPVPVHRSRRRSRRSPAARSSCSCRSRRSASASTSACAPTSRRRGGSSGET